MTILLQRLRVESRLGISALARKADMSNSTVGQIESGYIGKPYRSQLEKLALALGYEGDPNDLIMETEDPR